MKTIKYIFEAVFIYFIFLVIKLVGIKLGRKISSIIILNFGSIFRSKKIIDENITKALGNISEIEKKNITNSMWKNYGYTFAEYLFMKKFRLDKFSNPHISIKGKDKLDEIIQSGKQAIFVSGHFANFELMAMELNKSGIKCAAIYRPLNNFFLNPLMEYLRMKYICPNQIPKGRAGMREIINKVKEGYSIALMVDQRVGEGPRVPFFNKSAHTTTIPAQLALKYNCKLVPIYLERKEGPNFEMTIYEPYKIEKTGNEDEDTKNITIRINQIIEKTIVKNPNQWIWSHNRWK